MALCPICGCKTDELDFVTDKVSDKEVKMCSFCQRQIHAFDEGKEPGEGHIRWLASVAGKSVSDRSDEVSKHLSELAEKFVSEEVIEEVATPACAEPVPVTNVKGASQAELLERIEALEKQLRIFKRSLLIKTILEICIPIILGIIIVLVFMSSDLFESLSELYGFFVQ